MIQTDELSVVGGRGISVPGATVIGRVDNHQQNDKQYYLFIQNDSANNPSSSWYVAKLNNQHYAMQKAIAPKSSQYIGVFLYDVQTNERIGRLDETAVWTTSDETIFKINSIKPSAQIIGSLLKTGDCRLTVEWQGLKSVLDITAMAASIA